MSTNTNTKRSAHHEAEASHFRLLELPPEIWTHICRMALPDYGVVHIRDPQCVKTTERATQQPNITKTCKAIRAETLPFFYAQEFAFHDAEGELEGLPSWVKAMISTGRWDDVQNCIIIITKHPMIRLHMAHCFEDQPFFREYSVKLSALQGDIPWVPGWEDREPRRFKLEIWHDPELVGLSKKEHKQVRESKSVMSGGRPRG